MNKPAETIRLVDSEDVFDYPIPSTERLESHYFISFHYRRWLKSEFRNLADLDVRAVGFDLFCEAQDEAPVGTLPMDERLLAKLAGVTLEEWKRLCERPIGPLYGWSACRCDNGHMRLYHKVVLEIAKEALGMREDHLEKRAADRERKRLKDLPGQIVRAGGTARMGEDAVFIMQFDQFLLDYFEGRQRRPNVVREALEKWSIEGASGMNLHQI
ncbi:hypothetical protein [Aliiroseovarius lamellibrachiae]|uniref:hypothetical protein n=1 Tax=Aliiroseovarius lamellibrachiae TaxID=1924933 RepID=UPI001BE025BD|nr:hypothetical protein [Aliiroseovarius lamellibrachiae]MBT2130105.1 hypothetical protein [Aliiroseovarius lamellibrachiae]